MTNYTVAALRLRYNTNGILLEGAITEVTNREGKHMETIKHRVTHYWSHRAESFEAQRLREYDSEKRARWLAEFFRYLPQGRKLRVLDIGTGTGFFCLPVCRRGT